MKQTLEPPPHVHGADPRVALSGDLDIYALESIEVAFGSLGGGHILIDVHKVRSVSAAFFGALMRLHKRLPESRIEVVGASDAVRRTFSAVGVTALVRLS